jgi:hypothetical protein
MLSGSMRDVTLGASLEPKATDDAISAANTTHDLLISIEKTLIGVGYRCLKSFISSAT